ncbi:metallophosphoesterase [Clostridium massiliamazoniense]|uniref:metallophosphoesterase n=1 Tax=Clostridium massiliamazoniense TaxID=1347366 RepID=UPI0006D83767|nr:metallophosphoesterase [Clostridium massiliamazoniense]
MIKRNRKISLLLALATFSTVISLGDGRITYAEDSRVAVVAEESKELEVKVEDSKVPKQVNVHMGDNPSSEVNITYTTVEGNLETIVTLNKVGSSEKVIVKGENSVGNANKYFHKIGVSNLEANTNYEYIVGTGDNIFKGKFKTAPAKGSKDSFKFAYIADTQVSNESNAKALGATLAEINKSEDLSFVYLAGDITDKATTETQWEQLFNNEGAFPTGGQDMFGNYLISVVQGNHDNNSLTRHINAPAEAGNIVYSYDYGPATFIMLNLEEARYSAEAREKQKQHLIETVNEAKARNQWTFVGFHKSIYTGASHIVDSDIIEARKYWAPVFSELDVDVVMQGHDHVYSRGFINEDGYNANPSKDENNNVINPLNAPLYMVGGHAGGLKWYSKKNYTVGTGDILAPGYSFLDVNSTDTGSDIKKEQVIVEMEVSKEEVTLNTYMFKYDTEKDEITTNKYLYDSMTMVRNKDGYMAKMSNINNVEGKAGVEFKIPVSLNKFPTDSVIRSSEMVLDIPEDLEVKDVQLNNKVIKASNWDHNVSENKLRIALANLEDEPIFVNNIDGDKNVVTLTVALKEDKNKDESTLVSMSQLTLRCEDNIDIDYDTSKAKSKITFVQKEEGTVVARELYSAEENDLLPKDKKAVAIEFTLTPNDKSVKYRDVEFYYSPEFTEKTGKVTYVALVNKNESLEKLSNIKNYTLSEGNTKSNNLIFGDKNNDGIDAQDALGTVSAWLRKIDVNEKDMVTINVSGDGRVNTRDAINIVDNFVSGKEFGILSK